MTLIFLSIAWVAGILVGANYGLTPSVISIGIVPLILIPFLSRHRKALLICSFCLFAFVGGNVYFQTSLPRINKQYLQFYNDQGVAEIKGMITSDPEVQDKVLVFQFSADTIQVDSQEMEISGKAIIRTSRYYKYQYGDILEVTGKLESPQQFNDFNYKDYLANQGIYSVIYYPQIETLDRGKGSRALAVIYSVRNRLSQSLSRALPEPQGSLAQGIFLGLRGNIPYSLKQIFARTGTMHLLAISGLHLSIIIGMLLSMGIWLFGRRYSIYIWLAFAAIWLYAIVTGAHPPVIRGAIMGSMFLIAEYLGRQRNASTALALAAAVMVGIEPRILWDASFQLSFLAMTGLVFLFPHFQAWGRKKVTAGIGSEGTASSICILAADSLAVTLAAILITWPVIAYHFGTVSFVGLPATLLILPALPGIIIVVALVSVIGLLTPFIAQILGWIAWLFLSYLMLVIQIYDALPFSFADLGRIHIWHVCCYYALLAGAMVVINHRRQFSNLISVTASKTRQHTGKVSIYILKLPRKYIIPPVLIATILVWAAILNMPDDKLHVSVLNIGQGDSILIQTPHRHDILIDGGPSPQSINLELSKKLPFWDKTIDVVVLTQPQADHVTGLVEVIQNYHVKQIIEPGISNDSAIYNQWLNLVHDKKIEHKTAHSGQVIKLGDGICIEVLHPPSRLLHNTSDDINANGLVLRLNWNRISFLFTADIIEEAEWHLIASRTHLNSTVLKVAHHGSQTSTSAEFLAVVRPEAAVISAGIDNRFGHPHPKVIARLAQKLDKDKIFLTSEYGTIEFITDGNRLWIKTEAP